MAKLDVTLYTREGCTLCDKAKLIIADLMGDFEFNYEEVDIDRSDELTELYGLMIPVVKIDGQEVQYGIIDKKFIYKAFSLKNNFN